MTEKRFWSEDYSVGYYTEIVDNNKELEDVPNPKKNLSIGEAVDLLNKLHEQNQDLKRENDFLIKQLLGEEKLKQEIADYHTSNGKLHRLNNALIRRLDEFCINYSDIIQK